MINTCSLFIVLLIASASALVSAPASAANEQPIVVFENVNVVPMDEERILRGVDVVVRNGKIASIRASGKSAPRKGTIEAAAGAYLLPGLAEMHAHIPGGNRQEFGRDVLFLYVANGITVARGMLGEPYHLELREQVARGEVLGPRIYTSGPSFNGRSVNGVEQAERMVREQAAAGYDFLKLHPGLERDEFDVVAATANELGIPFAGHVSIAVGVPRTLEAGQATIDHLDGYMQTLVADEAMALQGGLGFFAITLTEAADEARIVPIVRATAAAGVWNVPTQSLIEHVVLPDPPEDLAARPEMQYMPPTTVRQWVQAKKRLLEAPRYDADRARRFVELRRQLIETMQQEGAGLLLGSDAPQVFNVPGFSIHDELAMLVASGLSPYQALRTGTVNPAVFFGADDRFGTVEVGKEADLILVDGNPLEDISTLQRPLGVMVRGRWLSRKELDAGLQKIARKNAE